MNELENKNTEKEPVTTLSSSELDYPECVLEAPIPSKEMSDLITDNRNSVSDKMNDLENKNTEKEPVTTLSSSELDYPECVLEAPIPSKEMSDLITDNRNSVSDKMNELENKNTEKEPVTTLSSSELDYPECVLEAPIPSKEMSDLITDNRNSVSDKMNELENKNTEKEPVTTLSSSELDYPECVLEAPIPSENHLMNQNILKRKRKRVSSASKEMSDLITDNRDKKRAVEIIPKPVIPVTHRKLRPIVIDGSNVARKHGLSSNTFSSKGIKIAIDYFLNRGHTEVTTFIPLFRRSNDDKRPVQTTDAPILDDLEKKQLVVFTPSRKVKNKYINCYDDRFIVKLAVANGGVIVSNDNYRDLIAENESFREAIENRLLMFCFVGDLFMVPDDPLGRNGPSLSDFLSFPPDDQNK